MEVLAWCGLVTPYAYSLLQDIFSVQLQGITLTNFDWSSCKNLDQNTKFVTQGNVCQNAVCYSVHVLNNGYQSFDTECGFSERMHPDTSSYNTTNEGFWARQGDLILSNARETQYARVYYFCVDQHCRACRHGYVFIIYMVRWAFPYNQRYCRTTSFFF